jgi:hypothetical protein
MNRQENQHMRAMRLTIGTAVAAAMLAGCGTGSAKSSTSSPAGGSASYASGSAATAAASTAATGVKGTSTGSGTSGSSSIRCHTKDLSLQVLQGPQNGSDTGDFYVQLTNISSRTCTLYGYPGVDLLGDNGGPGVTSLGMKDHWSVKLAMSGKKQTQTLAPNASSAAYVTFTTRPVGATAGFPRASQVRVIPPDETTALTAKIDNVDSGPADLLITSTTLTVGPMDIDGVPHK